MQHLEPNHGSEVCGAATGISAGVQVSVMASKDQPGKASEIVWTPGGEWV